jgi:hypothetical protein
MIFKVQITQQAEAELNEAYEWIANQSLEQAVVWFKGLKSKRLWSQQKGHAECMDAFLRAVRGEDVVIPSWEETRNVTRATVLVREAVRSGVSFRVE